MLSGGQKARLALARAVYQQKEVYLIDDIFSAVDVPVGSVIYRKCIQGILRNKTRILCTHHPRFLSGCCLAIVLEEGRIVRQGPPQSVLSMVDLNKESEKQSGSEGDAECHASNDGEEDDDNEDFEDLVEEERQEQGRVKYAIYKNYWFSVGSFLSPLVLLSLFLMQASRNFADIWLAEWVSADQPPDVVRYGGNSSSIQFYLTVYGSIGAANSFLSMSRAFLFAYGGICAAKSIHQRLLSSVLRAKTVFFDSTPTGRILNRFSSDVYTVDDSLPFILNIFLAQLVGIIGPVAVCTYSIPWIVLALVPLSVIYYDVQKKYRPAARDLKRMCSVSLSPIYAHFSETFGGLATIRAMKESTRFIQENEIKVEENQKAQYAAIAARQYLELRLQLIGCIFVSGSSALFRSTFHFHDYGLLSSDMSCSRDRTSCTNH